MKNGFTLLEVVLALAALSIMSVFVLQMYTAASGLNDRAKNIDVAVTVAVSEIEALKEQQSLSADNPIDTYYGADWNRTDAADARYRLTMALTAEEKPLRSGGALYAIEAEVVDMASSGNGSSLCVLRTKKYFPKGLVGNPL